MNNIFRLLNFSPYETDLKSYKSYTSLFVNCLVNMEIFVMSREEGETELLWSNNKILKHSSKFFSRIEHDDFSKISSHILIILIRVLPSKKC